MIYFRTDKDELHTALVINKHFAAYEENSKIKVIRRKHIAKVSKHLNSLCDYFKVPCLCGIWFSNRCYSFKEALNHMKRNHYDLKYIEGYIGDKQVAHGTSEGELKLL